MAMLERNMCYLFCARNSGLLEPEQLSEPCSVVVFFCCIRKAMRSIPRMADLPAGRAAFNEPPFSNCGVDLFGPIYIKDGRKKLKRWAVLFTCLTVRCIHMEFVENADTDAFINSLRRFINRRGCPQNKYSDQGSNFVGATTELKEFVCSLKKNHLRITVFMTSMKINWNFNPPSSPHMGGVWERLVRSVKKVMYGLVKNQVLTDPQLLTLLTEVESIINCRPLTHISDDVNDLEALTPNHILLGKHRCWSYMDGVDKNDVTSRKRYKQVQALSAQFWLRWKREYLPTLMKRPKWRSKVVNFKVGELVLLQDDEQKRRKWPLARIIDVMPGDDGVVRVVKIRSKNGEYIRPVVKLYKLEETNSDEENNNDVRQDGEDVTHEMT